MSPEAARFLTAGWVGRCIRDHARLWRATVESATRRAQGAIAAKLAELEQQLNREPTREELAAHLGVALEEIEQAMAARGCFNVLSLDRPSDEDADLTLADVVADDGDWPVSRLEAVDMLQLSCSGSARGSDVSSNCVSWRAGSRQT